jgi:hypothetical protein
MGKVGEGDNEAHSFDFKCEQPSCLLNRWVIRLVGFEGHHLLNSSIVLNSKPLIYQASRHLFTM